MTITPGVIGNLAGNEQPPRPGVSPGSAWFARP